MSLADARAADAAFAKLHDARRAGGLPLHSAPQSTKPPAAIVRARMVEAVRTLYSSRGAITLGDLESWGFEPEEIAEHFRPALRLARVDRMVA